MMGKNVIGSLKRFKIISERYRNRRKMFSLRFNLISGIHNYEIKNNRETGSRRDAEGVTKILN